MPQFLLAFLILLYAITHGVSVTTCVENSLLLWYHSIFPILFPGMLCSGFMLPFLKQFAYRNSNSRRLPILILLPGFLCGFPLGTYLVTDLYRQQILTKEQANIYIGFTNNISPLFMLSIVLTDYPFGQKILLFLLFYSVPLLYGLTQLSVHKRRKSMSHPVLSAIKNPTMEENMNRAMENILKIAGYIVFFRLIVCILGDVLFGLLSFFHLSGDIITGICMDVINSMLEISSGVISLKERLPETSYWKVAFPFLTFGGWCTCMQSKALLLNTDLSFSAYVRHKTVQTVLMSLLCLLLP